MTNYVNEQKQLYFKKHNLICWELKGYELGSQSKCKTSEK